MVKALLIGNVTIIGPSTSHNLELNVTRYYLAELTFKGYRNLHFNQSYCGAHRVLVSLPLRGRNLSVLIRDI